MKESEGNRRYKLELGGAMVLYMVTLFVAIRIGRPMEAGLHVRSCLAHPSSQCC